MMDQILIDFRAGSHGNFLEFLLNCFYHDAKWTLPFNHLGAAHNKNYQKSTAKFFSAHFTELDSENQFYRRQILNNNDNIILITIKTSDLLLLQTVSLLRAGNHDMSDNLLEIDTYKKLNNKWYGAVLDCLVKNYNLTVDENNPNISRHILREFFKFGFKTPEIHGFIKKQQSAKIQLNDKNVYEIPFAAFYDYNQLATNLQQIYTHYNIDATVDLSYLKTLHDSFLSKIPYRNIKKQCDEIVAATLALQNLVIPKLSLLQESYINANLEIKSGREMPFNQDVYFTSTQDIIKYLEL
jgi:hypothetical protein